MLSVNSLVTGLAGNYFVFSPAISIVQVRRERERNRLHHHTVAWPIGADFVA
jgi:hypothetical protein